MEYARDLIRVSLVADARHILQVNMEVNMDATIAIKGEGEGIVFISADADLFPVTRIGDAEADLLSALVKRI